MALPYATENQLKEISKRIKNIIENKQDKLIEGENISIKDNVISARSPIKVYDWELEKDEATGNIYVKDPDAYNNFEKLISENALINLYFPNEDFESGKIYLGHFFISYGLGLSGDQTAIDLGYLAGNTAAGGSPNDIYHIYLMGDEEKQKLKYNLVKVETGGSSQPLELTGVFDTSNPQQQFKDITLTDEQVATIKSKYENKEPLIVRVKYFPIENMGYVFDIQNMGVFSRTENGVNDYSFTTLISVNMFTTLNLLITIDTSTKTLSCREQKLLNEKETSLGIIEQNSELRINSSYGDTPAYIGESIYIDTINGKKTLHTETTINNYYAPTTINETATPKILQSKNSQMEWIDLPSSGGGESVSPTLNLMDLGEGTVRTTITEQEKLNLDKGLYNQVYYFRSNQGLDGLSIYMPSRLFSLFEGSYLFSIMIAADENNPVVNNLEFYTLTIGEKNADGEYPITIQSGKDSGLPNVSFSSGGSSEIPTLSTIAPSMSDLATTVYSDDDIALIKKQKDNFIKVPFGTAENNASELCYVYSFNNAYSLIDVAGFVLALTNAFAEAPNFLYFDLDETTKKLTGRSYSSLSTSETSLYVESSANKIFLTDQLNLSSPTQVLNKAYYFDKINGKSIIHEDSTINNYDLGKTINLFGNHSILVPNASTDTEINLYNHFIKITGNASEVESGANIIARFTIQSSNNLVVDTPEKLTTLLGNEFELGCNGIYGNYNITGLKKTADGTLNIIYNNGGAESLLSTTGITLTIEDNVKNI